MEKPDNKCAIYVSKLSPEDDKVTSAFITRRAFATSFILNGRPKVSYNNGCGPCMGCGEPMDYDVDPETGEPTTMSCCDL